MRAALLCVGKLKEKYWRDACAEYLKRLTRYGQVELIEVPDAPEPAHASPGADAQVLRIEGERLLAKIRSDDYVIALAIDGKSYTSVGFAEHVEKVMLKGRMVCLSSADHSVCRLRSMRGPTSESLFRH